MTCGSIGTLVSNHANLSSIACRVRHLLLKFLQGYKGMSSLHAVRNKYPHLLGVCVCMPGVLLLKAYHGLEQSAGWHGATAQNSLHSRPVIGAHGTSEALLGPLRSTDSCLHGVTCVRSWDCRHGYLSSNNSWQCQAEPGLEYFMTCWDSGA